MRMTSWFESVRRQFGSATWTKSRRHGSGRTRRQPPVFVESLEDRCLLAAGDLDPSFGTGGRVTTAFSTDAKGAAIAVQSDGKIVVAGSAFSIGSNFDFAVARYNADGSLDTSFGDGGKLTTDFGSNDEAASIALQADGKIVVVGYTSLFGFSDFAMARYNTNGSLDMTFDDDGIVTTDFAMGHDYARSVVLQTDGKIVVAGIANNGSDDDFALARYHNDGSLDSSFDGDGTLTTDLTLSDDRATSIALQTNGKIVVAGSTNAPDGVRFGLTSYLSDGSLDMSFDGDGKLSTKLGIEESQASSMALQADGKIVVAGYATHPGSGLFGANGDFALARYNTDGSLDQSFDGNGKVTTRFGNSDDVALNGSLYAQDRATSIALQSNGQIVVAGITLKNHGNDFALARYNTDGSLDTSFDEDGKITTPFGRTDDQATSIAVQPNGKIVVAGFTDNEGGFEFALARYAADEESAVVALPEAGGSFIALVAGGMLHVRRTRTSPDLVPPVALRNLSTIRIEGSNRNDRLTLDRSLSSFAGTITFNGSDGNDYLDAKAIGFNVTFNGGNGNDTLLGGKGDDTAYGGVGNDSLSGSDGDDSLSGGEGNDRINGDVGNDTITGDAGADSINGGNDDDVLLGKAGRDTIDGGRSDDVIDGGDDNDSLKGSDGDDAIRGGNGNDTLSGGNGNDLLTASAGNDSLKGDAGTDTLLGDAGNDKLDGGTSIDTINGVLTGPSRDTISDTTKVIDTSFAYDFDALLAGLL